MQRPSVFLRAASRRILLVPAIAAGLVAMKAGAAPETPANLHVFYIGHSLMSDIPGMTRSLVTGDGVSRFGFRHQDIPGASIAYQWDAPKRKTDFEPQFGGLYHVHLPKEDFNVLLVTDSVPRGGPYGEKETIESLGKFVDFARKYRPEIRIYYYETWPHLTSGTPQRDRYDNASPTRELPWRKRIDADRPMWERIVATVNRAHPGKHPVVIIPTGRVLAAVSDAVEAGKVPGMTKTSALFSDAIHTNHYGKYVVALSHAAALTGRSPVGMPVDLKDCWGGAIWGTKHWNGVTYARPKPETVRALQEVVAKVIPTAL